MSDLNDEVRARIERDDSLRLIDRHLEIEAELRDSPALPRHRRLTSTAFHTFRLWRRRWR
jgi:hypothetical protein